MRFTIIIENNRKQIAIIPEDESDRKAIEILRALPQSGKISTRFGSYVHTRGEWIREGAGCEAFMIVFDPPDPPSEKSAIPDGQAIRAYRPGEMVIQEPEEKPAFLRRIME